MLKIIVLILFTTFSFTNSDVKLLELPKESKHFGASIKDYYRNDQKGSYTYIFENKDGAKQRQDGIYGEKRGYYTFKAPLPDGRTYTVCYYTRNGYHAKTTIIEVVDVEAFCDMIIEQSGNVKLQSPKSQSKETTSFGKIESSKIEKPSISLQRKSQKSSAQNENLTSSDSSTPFKIQTEKSSQSKNKLIQNQVTRKKPIQTTSTQQTTLHSSEDVLNNSGNENFELTSTKVPFIIIEEPLEKKFDTETTTNLASELQSETSSLTALDIDSAPPSDAPQFDIPIATNLRKVNTEEVPITFCDDESSDLDNNNSNIDSRFSNGCVMKVLPTKKISTTKVDELIADIFKYGIKKPDPTTEENVTEILPPSKIFLPPYIDDESDLLRPSIELIPPTSNDNVILTTDNPIETTFIIPTDISTPSKQIIVAKEKATTKKPITITTKTTKKLITTTKRPITIITTTTTTKKPITSTTTVTTPRSTSTRKSLLITTSTKNPTQKGIIIPNKLFTPPKIEFPATNSTITNNNNNNNNILRPNLDLIPPFNAPSFDLLPPIANNDESASIFDVRFDIDDRSKNISSNIVSRSISNPIDNELDCKHGILKTDPKTKSYYISPRNVEELEAIQNLIKLYGCKTNTKTTKRHRLQRKNEFHLETELNLKNCRIDIVKLDRNGKISYLDPESLDEFNVLRELNRIYGCYKN